MSMLDLSLLDTVIVTVAVLLTMAIISCLCCVSIKLREDWLNCQVLCKDGCLNWYMDGYKMGLDVGCGVFGERLSDMKLKKCIVEMSQKKGVPVDIEKLELKQVYKPPNPDDPCAIVVPDLGIVVAW